MEVIAGKYIVVHQLNVFFAHVTAMLLEHFDRPEYQGALFPLGTYIFTSVEVMKRDNPGRRIIIYQLEQLMGIGAWHSVPKTIDNMRGADEIGDYDPLNIAYLQQHNLKVDRLVPMLYTKSLDRIATHDAPDFDILFYGLINERRFRVFQTLQSQLYGKIRLGWSYGDANIDKHVANCKIVLNLHAFEPWNRQEQVRMFYAVINKKCVVSEPSQVNNMPGEIIETPVESMATTLIEMCSTDAWREFGERARQRFIARSHEFLMEQFGRKDVAS